jgi:hypothetical protein
MGDLDATLCHHLDQVSVRQPIGDVPPHAQLDDVGIEYTFAVHRVTRDRLRHSEPPAKDPAVYPMPLDAPEPGFRSFIRFVVGSGRRNRYCEGPGIAALPWPAARAPKCVLSKGTRNSIPFADTIGPIFALEGACW